MTSQCDPMRSRGRARGQGHVVYTRGYEGFINHLKQPKKRWEETTVLCGGLCEYSPHLCTICEVDINEQHVDTCVMKKCDDKLRLFGRGVGVVWSKASWDVLPFIYGC